MASQGLINAFAAVSKAAFDASKHKRGQGGKFAFQGGAKKPAPKASGSVASAHALFDKMKGQPKKDVLAAAAAAGINPNTAKTQLYHWQKKQAVAALGGKANPTKADLQEAAAKALGVKPAAIAPAPKPAPKAPEPPAPNPTPVAETKPAKSHAEQYKAVLDGPGTDSDKQDKLFELAAEHHKQAAGNKAKQKAVQEEYTKATATLASGKVAAPSKDTHGAPDLEKLGPTKYVHALADFMPTADKKMVIAAATAAGVHPSTAGVQYGKWAKAKAGEPPQLAKSPEPKALQAKQPEVMSDKELDKAIDSYQGKVAYKSESAAHKPSPYNHKEEYHDHQGGKALTAKLGNNEIYTNQSQGKTFFKSVHGDVYEHSGGVAGPMTKLTGTTTSEYHYDPSTQITYQKTNGVLKAIIPKTPVFKNQQPLEDQKHAFTNHAWAKANGIQDPTFSVHTSSKHYEQAKKVWEKAGVTYNGDSSAVISYTSDGYKSINNGLRNSEGKTVSPRAKQLDELISKSSFKEDTVMWRGVGQGGTVWNGAPPPVEVTDHGFTSVSFSPNVAQGFSDNKTVFRVRVPKGFPGLNVAIGQPSGGGAAGLQSEAEVLLPRGTTYRVVERHPQAGPLVGWPTKKGMDVVDLEPVLPEWYIKKYGQPKLG